MGNFSTYAIQHLLDHIFKVTSYTVPTNIYVALSTANPLTDGSGIAEPSGNAYARTLCNGWTLTSSTIGNTAQITFPEATGSWGTIAYFALYDASTSGNLLAFGALGTSKLIGSGDTPDFAAGAFTATIT